MLYLNNIQCERGERVIFTGLSLSVTEGTLLRLAGDNGSGKTTLLRIIAGLNNNYRGKLRFHSLPDKSSSLLFIGHQPGIKLSLTPLENLQWWQALYDQWQKEACIRALGQVGIAHEANTLCCRLSAGQRQRVALARLWLSDATFWLLDEPFTALDQVAVNTLAAQLLQHMQRKGVVIFTTHQMPERLKAAIKEICMNDYQPHG